MNPEQLPSMLDEFNAFFASPAKLNDLSGFAVAACGMRDELLARLGELENEVGLWRYVATHRYVCPLGEMNPGEPGSYIVRVTPHHSLFNEYHRLTAPEGASDGS